MKSKRLIKLSLTLLTLLSLCFGIIVPRYLLTDKYSRNLDSIETAPESYYKSAGTAMAKRASELLSPLEKINLITGVLGSTCQEVETSNSSLSETDAVELAKKQIQLYYDKEYYPASLLSNYGNWYSWSTKLYSFTDTTFNTYTGYLWDITFTKFDNSLIHNILMTEDGIILYASINFNRKHMSTYNMISNRLDFTKILSDSSIKFEAENPISISNFIDTLSSIYEYDLSLIKLEGAYDVNTTKVSLWSGSSSDDYIFYQYKTPDDYCIGVLPASIFNLPETDDNDTEDNNTEDNNTDNSIDSNSDVQNQNP